MDGIRDRLPDKLRLNTQTWGPHRFALTRLIDGIAQEVYMALGDDELNPREAEDLLGHLGMASWYLYEPGSQRRRLMSPTGGRRKYPSYKSDFSSRRRRNQQRQLTIDIPICSKGTGGSKSRKGRMEDADRELLRFIQGLDDVNGDTHDWEKRAAAIRTALPAEVDYYKVGN